MARVIESARAAAAWSSPHEQFQWGGAQQQADADRTMTWQHKITSMGVDVKRRGTGLHSYRITRMAAWDIGGVR